MSCRVDDYKPEPEGASTPLSGQPADDNEPRSPHGLEHRSEHLHSRSGRDAEEGDGEHGRSVREQGEGLTGWNYDGSGRLPGVFAIWIEISGGK